MGEKFTADSPGYCPRCHYHNGDFSAKTGSLPHEALWSPFPTLTTGVPEADEVLEGYQKAIAGLHEENMHLNEKVSRLRARLARPGKRRILVPKCLRKSRPRA